MKIYVTGIGIVSAIGNQVTENHAALKVGKTGIGKSNFFESKYAETLPFGEVKLSNQTLEQELDLNLIGATRTELLAFKAFKEAVCGLTKLEISDPKTAFISASTVGGMCLTDQLYSEANLLTPKSIHTDFYSCCDHTLAIAKKYGINGICNTFNTACSSSANSIAFGARLIKSRRANRAIVGGVDCLAKFTVNGFNALTILSDVACKSFDENRKGLNLGEAAAFLVLENEESLNNRIPLAVLSGYGNANDAFHASALSEDAIGVKASIEAALKEAKLNPEEIDYINMHGTGTENNDYCELKGCLDLFSKLPPFNSTKTFTGHTLAAAGAVEAIYSILSIVHQELYPNLNFNNPIRAFNKTPILTYQKNQNIQHVLSNSFGFSGNCSSLIFSKA